MGESMTFPREAPGRVLTQMRPAAPHDWPAIEALPAAAALPLDGAREHLGDFVERLLGPAAS